jgi:hypothetical protein
MVVRSNQERGGNDLKNKHDTYIIMGTPKNSASTDWGPVAPSALEGASTHSSQVSSALPGSFCGGWLG